MALAAIIVLVLVSALFIKKEYLIEREISINKPKTEVFEYNKYLNNRPNYSVWTSMDPDMIKEFSGTDGTVGIFSSWESQNKSVGNRIDYKLRFVEPFEDKGNYLSHYLKPWRLIHYSQMGIYRKNVLSN